MPGSRAARAIGFTPQEISALVNRRVVQEHVSEAAFLWMQRERAVGAPHYRLDHLVKLDARVTAHLEGLVLSGTVGRQMADQQLGTADPGSLFVAAHLAFRDGDARRMSQALQIALADPVLLPALTAALAWMDRDGGAPWLDRLTASRVPVHRTIALGVRALRRDPAATQYVSTGARDTDPELRARALRAIGELKQHGLQGLATEGLRDEQPTCRFWAAWSAALLGDSDAARVAWETARDDPALQPHAVEVAMRCGEAGWARDVVRMLAGTGATRRLAVRAAAAYGDPVVVPWLLAQLEDKHIAREAAEAISTITGADLSYLGLKADPPTDAEEPETPGDDALDWPHPVAMRQWWSARASRFTQGVRHLCGLPVSPGAARDVLRRGYQRQRRAAAIEFARLSGPAPLFPVRERADRQIGRLAA
jgi:uncharacterized protein (TIGR02270 family)